MNKKKIILLSILIVIITVVTGISVTYALWQSKHIGSSNNIVNSGCLNIEFKNFNDDINLDRTYPGDDRLTNRYYFQVYNTCSTVVSYDVNLETLEGSDLDPRILTMDVVGYNMHDKAFNDIEEMCAFFETDYSDSVTKLIDTYGKQKRLSSYDYAEPSLDNALYSNNIYSGVLGARESHLFAISVNLWKWTPADNAFVDKTWNSKITFNSTGVGSMYEVNFDTGDVQNNLSSISVQSGMKYGKLPEPKKDGYILEYWYLDNDESKAVTENTIVTKNENHVLRAKWVRGTLLRNNSFSKFLYDRRYYITDIVKYSGDYYSLGIDSVRISDYDLINSYDTLYYTTSPIYDGNALEIQEDGYDKVYAWVDGTVLYYYTDSPLVFFNTYDGFRGYKDLTNIDLTNFRTNKMNDMSYMFDDCCSLTNINLSFFDTRNVISMRNMFCNCRSLVNLDLSSFVTSNVVMMRDMFNYCYSLSDLNVSSFDTRNVLHMESMFAKCTSLQILDLRNFVLNSNVSLCGIFGGLSQKYITVLHNDIRFDDNSLYIDGCCGEC